MLNKIKEIKLSKIKDELARYESLSEEIKRLDDEIKEIDKLESPQMPYEHLAPLNYSLLSKLLFKRKEYLEKVKERNEALSNYDKANEEYYKKRESLKSLEEKKNECIALQASLSNVLEEYKQISSANNIKDLGMTFEEATSFLIENNEEVILDESDLDIINNESNFESKKDFCLVHKTMYSPKNSKVSPAFSQNIMKSSATYFDGEEFTFNYNVGRNTVHFCLNGEVTSHSLGVFEGREYAVIMPFEKADDSTLTSLRGEDTYFEGPLSIKGGYILCIKDKLEEVKKNNPEVTVIGVDNSNIDGYANAFLSMLGYKNEEIGTVDWTNEKDSKKLRTFIEDNGYLNDVHYGSYDDYKETAIEYFSKIIGFVQTIKEKMQQGKTYDVDKLLEMLYEKRKWVVKDGKRTVDDAGKLEVSVTKLLYYTLNAIDRGTKDFKDIEHFYIEDCFGEKLENDVSSSSKRNLNYLFYKLKTLYNIDINEEIINKLSALTCEDNKVDHLTIERSLNEELDKNFIKNLVSELYLNKDAVEEYSEGIKR